MLLNMLDVRAKTILRKLTTKRTFVTTRALPFHARVMERSTADIETGAAPGGCARPIQQAYCGQPFGQVKTPGLLRDARLQ
jgi:hypothetical protein